jgi:hypothetical protein
MKRFTVFSGILSVSLLAVWTITQFVPAPKNTSALKADNAPAPVYDATGEMLKAIHAGDQANIPVSGVESRIAPVYDATGAMLDAINPNKKAVTIPAYDATGAMLDTINPDTTVITVPAYDATGAMQDAINP